MKTKLLFAFLVLLGLTSCKKETIEPENTITYRVECDYCYFKYDSQGINVSKYVSISFVPEMQKDDKLSVSKLSHVQGNYPVSLQVYKGGKLLLNERVVLGNQGINEWVFRY